MNRYPRFKQLDASDCGATSLRMVTEYYGRKNSAEYYRNLCRTSRDGVSVLDVCEAATTIGFNATGIRLTLNQLCEEIPLPAILHWNQNHFVVLYNIKKKFNKLFFYIADPAISYGLKYEYDVFKKHWLSHTNSENIQLGIAIALEPTEKLHEYKDKSIPSDRMNYMFYVRYLLPYKKEFYWIGLFLCIGSIISYILPTLTKSIVDEGIEKHNYNFLFIIFLAQFSLVMGQTINNIFRNKIMLSISNKTYLNLVTDFLEKLMRLPISFFDSKIIGDIMQRIEDNSRIQSFLSNSVLNFSISIVTISVFSVVIALYDLNVFFVFLTGSILYICWTIVFLEQRSKLDYKRFQETAANQSNTVQLITGMQDIKLNHCEKKRLELWREIQLKIHEISVKRLNLNNIQDVGGTFIDQTKNIVISYMTASAVISGDISIGIMIAIQYILGQLNGPVAQLSVFLQQNQDAKNSAERLNEIHKRKDEEDKTEHKICEIPNGSNIEFENVTFSYDGNYLKKVINNISFSIELNKTIAIVGNSGSGKTTLLKLILGFYKPNVGSISVNGFDISEYSESFWRSQCAVVMQEGYIFSDSIAGNISISSENIDMERVKNAARIANIDSFIESLPLSYDTKIGVDGFGLSSGQKQRILIARAAYKNCRYIIFDEATNSLDANNELDIIRNLNGFFKNKTVIMVAHRLSTVKNADKIIVLNDGEIVEQGKHEQLISSKGFYYNLVRNQIELSSN